MVDAVMYSSATARWSTPQEFWQRLHGKGAPVLWWDTGEVEVLAPRGYVIDLAADPDNTKLPTWLGPGSPLGEDALAVDWEALVAPQRGPAWLNPPYQRAFRACSCEASKEGRLCDTPRPKVCGRMGGPLLEDQEGTATWVAKAYKETVTGACAIDVLLPARTDQPWWHLYVSQATAVLYARGRLRHGKGSGGEKGGAAFPSVVVLFGDKPPGQKGPRFGSIQR